MGNSEATYYSETFDLGNLEVTFRGEKFPDTPILDTTVKIEGKMLYCITWEDKKKFVSATEKLRESYKGKKITISEGVGVPWLS